MTCFEMTYYLCMLVKEGFLADASKLTNLQEPDNLSPDHYGSWNTR